MSHGLVFSLPPRPASQLRGQLGVAEGSMDSRQESNWRTPAPHTSWPFDLAQFNQNL